MDLVFENSCTFFRKKASNQYYFLERLGNQNILWIANNYLDDYFCIISFDIATCILCWYLFWQVPHEWLPIFCACLASIDSNLCCSIWGMYSITSDRCFYKFLSSSTYTLEIKTFIFLSSNISYPKTMKDNNVALTSDMP